MRLQPCSRLESRLQRVELPGVRRAALEAKPGASGDDVEGPRLDLDVPDGRHTPRETSSHRLSDTQHEGGCSDSGIPSLVHRGRAGVTCLTVERDTERARADDCGDDSDLDSNALEHGPLLDVKLEVARERSRITAGGQQTLLCQPQAGELGSEDITSPSRCAKELRRQRARKRAAAQSADQRPFLVREVDGFECDRQIEAGVLDGAEHLESAHDPERTVVCASVHDGVEVRAEQQRPGRGVRRQKDGGVVEGRVDAELEPGRLGPSTKPAPRSRMPLRERGALDATVSRCPDLRQSIEVRAQTVGIDSKRHSGDASAVAEPRSGTAPP